MSIKVLLEFVLEIIVYLVRKWNMKIQGAEKIKESIELGT